MIQLSGMQIKWPTNKTVTLNTIVDTQGQELIFEQQNQNEQCIIKW